MKILLIYKVNLSLPTTIGNNRSNPLCLCVPTYFEILYVTKEIFKNELKDGAAAYKNTKPFLQIPINTVTPNLKGQVNEIKFFLVNANWHKQLCLYFSLACHLPEKNVFINVCFQLTKNKYHTV